MTTTLMIPRVHLNGTSREELLRQLAEAREAIITAMAVMGRAAPHGRDYYVISDEAITQARDAHFVRIGKLQAVLDELGEISDGILAQEGR